MENINSDNEICSIVPLYLKLHPTLKYNEESFAKIVKKYPWLVVYAARKLRNDKLFLEKMTRANGMVLQYLQEHYILKTVPADNFRGWEFKKDYIIDDSFIVIESS